MAETSGGEVLARILEAEGVTRVFGIIDGTYFGFYSALHRLGIEIVTPRHETSAAHMAGAYARLTAGLGVCMASNGPGVANLLPGLVVEQAEGNRVLAVTSCRRPQIVYPDRSGTYQAFDQVGAIRRVAKWSECAATFDRVAELGHAALRQCFEGRPGVVHLDVPETVMNGRFKQTVHTLQPHEYRRTEALPPPADQVQKAAELLSTARAPMIHAGSGVIHARAFRELKRVADLLQAPVTTSWAARGALSEKSELAIPMWHVKLNHTVRNEADVALVLGSRLGETDWWGKPPHWRPAAEQATIQVDVDGAVLGANRPVAIAVQSDIRLFLDALAERLESYPSNREERRRAIQKYRRAVATERAQLDEKLQDLDVPMNPAHVARACQQAFPEGSVLVADGGNTVTWTMFYHEARIPNTLLSTFKFGMLGAGIAQALGAAVARPEQPVCCIIGDGAMGYHPQEVETAVRQPPARRLRRRLRPRLGHGEDEPAVRIHDDQGAAAQVARLGRADPRRPGRNPVRQARGVDGRPRRARRRPARAAGGAHARDRLRRPGRRARRRRPGQAHVGARSRALQGHAPGAEGPVKPCS